MNSETQLRYIAWVIYHGILNIFTLQGLIALSIYVVTISFFPAALPHYLSAMFSLLAGFAVIVYLGHPMHAIITERNLKRAGVVDEFDEPPKFLGITKRGNVIKMRFLSVGVPLTSWLEKKDAVASALNGEVIDIYEHKGKQKITVEYVKSRGGLPTYLEWNDTYITDNDELVIGRSALGTETVDLEVTPHILIGGTSGSGKTVLMKLLLYQAIQKNWQVYIADFKGGLDYPWPWKNYVRFMTSKKDVIRILDSIINEMESRKVMFLKENVNNLTNYNKSCSPLPRLVFACDELAEMLDKNGLSKSEKEEVDEISKRLATLARLGRAYGIHLILGTQRPDANILNGQIKNNFDYRICGRADSVLSQIVLDDTIAADIPKQFRGRFVNGEGQIIQTYYFNGIPKGGIDESNS